MSPHATKVLAAALALAVTTGATGPAIAQEPAATPTAAQASAAPGPLPQEAVELPDAPGRDKVAQCGACHSLDYLVMNSRFLDLAGWTAVVNKMIKAFGAPIPGEDVDAIAGYLAEHYGKPAASP